MSTQIINKSNWISIDYPGWECVCFDNMKWRFSQNGQDVSYRDIKKDINGIWLITDDYGEFVRYDRDGESTELLEFYYNEWLFKAIEIELSNDWE